MDANITFQLRDYLDEKFRPVYEGIAKIEKQLESTTSAVRGIDTRVVRLEAENAEIRNELREQKVARDRLFYWVVTLVAGGAGYLIVELINTLR